MGLSSSQARLLHLTGRMHQIEYKAAKLEAEKLQMANESRRVYLDYQNALEATKIQRATLNTDGSLNYVDATYNALLKDGYRLGKCEYMAVSQEDIDTFNSVADSNPAEFAAIKSGYAVKNGNDITLAKDSSIHLAFTADQLKAYAAAGNNIVLMDDINVTESMGDLTSSLNGNGHTINVSGSSGIFDTINGGNVQNIKINANIVAPAGVGNCFGALANKTTGNVSIENVVETGEVDAATNGTPTATDCGGLVGWVKDGVLNVNNVTTTVSIKGVSDTGSIVGYTAGSVNISNVTANVKIESDSAGGILGGKDSPGSFSIDNCRVNADIDAYRWGGGIVDKAVGNISNCYVTGSVDVVANSMTDKIDSNGNPNVINAGGICGYATWWSTVPSTISNCYVDNTVSCTAPLGIAITKEDKYYTDDTYNLYSISNCATPNDANAGAVKALVSSVGNKGSLTQTYNPSDETSINDETSNTVGADYDHYLEIGQAIADDKYFLIDGHEDDTEWLTNLVNSGFVTIQKKDEDGNFFDTSVSTDTHLQEVADETGLRKAEAKYEADMRRIDNKDKKFDYDLAALDNERNAIKQEMETLQTVAKNNVERTFKLFS